MKPNLEFHLGRALNAMDRMEASLINVTEQQFLSSDLMVDAVSTNLLRVNMAYRFIAEQFPNIPQAHPDLDWEGVSEISIKLIDEIMDIDNEWIWRTAAQAMPIQKQMLSQKFGMVERE